MEQYRAGGVREREVERRGSPADGVGIVGTGPRMERLMRQVRLAAPSDATVLLTGESGTGKERIARALHHLSARRDAPFVAVSCAALSPTLLESELFGHERGAFTGADARRMGRFEQAHGGTLFLDEIAEAPPAAQAKLLRVVQERAFERVGGTRAVRVDVRLVAATGRNLRSLLSGGGFRADLFWRLAVIPLDVPPLRARRRDVVPLWRQFVLRHAGPGVETRDAALAALVAYDWPGNVRELENAAQRAALLAGDGPIGAEHLPPGVAGRTDDPRRVRIPGATLAEIERSAILRTWEAEGFNARRAADVLGISERKVRYRLQAFRRAGLV